MSDCNWELGFNTKYDKCCGDLTFCQAKSLNSVSVGTLASAVRKGCKEAGVRLALRFFASDFFHQAFSLFERYALKGYQRAILLLAFCLFHGYGTTPQKEKAIERLQSLIAGDEPYVPALHALGSACFQLGNKQDAIYWYTRGANQECVFSQQALGIEFYKDKRRDLAAKYFSMAAQQGDLKGLRGLAQVLRRVPKLSHTTNQTIMSFFKQWDANMPQPTEDSPKLFLQLLHDLLPALLFDRIELIYQQDTVIRPLLERLPGRSQSPLGFMLSLRTVCKAFRDAIDRHFIFWTQRVWPFLLASGEGLSTAETAIECFDNRKALVALQTSSLGVERYAQILATSEMAFHERFEAKRRELEQVLQWQVDHERACHDLEEYRKKLSNQEQVAQELSQTPSLSNQEQLAQELSQTPSLSKKRRIY
jgi:TPR repeat protein